MMWWDRDSNRCCSEGSEVGGRDNSRCCSEGSVGWEVWTAVGVNCCEGSKISWIVYLRRVRDSSRCCSEGSEMGTEDVVG